MRRSTTMGSILLLTLAMSLRGQTILYVDSSADQMPLDGSDWCHAHLQLYEALAAAGPNTVIRVADGTYRPDTFGLSDPREATFRLVNGVTIEGGYAGCGAPNPDDRNILLYESTLSGDLNGDDAAVTSPYDLLDEPTRAENSYHVVTGNGTDDNTRLDGFTITAGHANGAAFLHRIGAGLFNDDGSPTLANCTFTLNVSSRLGAGMYNDEGDPKLANCSFIKNHTIGPEPRESVAGGGLYNNTGSPTLVNCRFIDNSAITVFGNSSADAGGVYSCCYGNPTMINCTFEGNSASAPWFADAGGLFLGGPSNPTLLHCTFRANSASTLNSYGRGGAIWTSAAPLLVGCTFSGNWTGSADGRGGALYNSGGATPTLVNCTFSDNSAARGGAIYKFGTGCNMPSVRLINCILWGDSPNEIKGHTSLVTHSDIQGGWPGLRNIDLNPMFVDAASGNLRLLPGSPCIDAGDNRALPPDHFDLDGDGDTAEPLPVDLNTTPRLVNIFNVPDTGIGMPPIVDMGAFEHLLDCNGNGVADEVDITGGTSYDCDVDGVPDECEPDCNDNGVSDNCDVAGSTSDDCNGNGIPDECMTLEQDCNDNGVPDECDITVSTSDDCNSNGLPDECEHDDCNNNGIPDDCDVAGETSDDCNFSGVPDDCEVHSDCNGNAIQDICDIAAGLSRDCNGNDIPDECERWGSILFVDACAQGANDGSTWANAFHELRVALASVGCASGTVSEIWVAEGVYTPAGPGADPTATFQLINGVAIYGGFASGEISREQRDFIGNETILSGDLDGDDNDCCFAVGAIGCSDRACEEIVCAFEPACCEVEWTWRCVAVANDFCTFDCYNNSHHVVTGSGTDETALLDGFTVTAGYAGGASGVGHSGAGMVNDMGSPALSNNTFTRNSARGFGGGIYNATGANPVLTNCTFTYNSAQNHGGGMYNDRASPTLTNCTFHRNMATCIDYAHGGAMVNYRNSDPVLANCTFTENSANGHAGAVFNWDHSSPTLANCTFSGNTAALEGGAVYNETSSPTLTNCILWGDDPDEIYNYMSTCSVTYSCIQDDDADDGSVYLGMGNIDDDPLLVGGGDLHLTTGSPCMNTGSNDAPELPETDADGHARILCTVVDMGAYEFGIGDYDCDQTVDLTDFASWPVCMTGPNEGSYAAGCEAFDFEYDGDVDLRDFAGAQAAFTGPWP